MLEVSADQIHSLQGRDADFVDLLRQLLRMEAFSHGLAAGGIQVSTQINVADGGEDGRIEWRDGPDRTDYLPARFSLFQVKATKMENAKCSSEVIVPKSKSLKPALDEILEKRGAYILFCTDRLSPTSLRARVSHLKRGIVSTGNAADGIEVLFYDANKIADWVNCYPSVQAWAHERIDQRFTYSLQSWESWSRNTRLRANSVAFALGETKTGKVSLAQLIADAPSNLDSPRSVIRLVGLSGLGKTRIALEMFRAPTDQCDLVRASRSAAVLYTDCSTNPDQIVTLLHQWRSRRSKLILVIDDCPVEVHRRLCDIASHPDSNVSIMTLDFDLARTDDRANRIEITPFDDSVTSEIIKHRCPGLSSSEISHVVRFADGFPFMAVLLGESLSGGNSNWASLQDDVLLKSLVWGRRPESEEGLNVISACSLFATIGISGSRVSERDFVATSLCQLSPERFHAWITKFEERGLIQRHGDVALVLPKPMALRLASSRWREILPERAEKWFAGTGVEAMPDRLLEAMCEQLSYLDFLPDARGFVERLCGPSGPFGQPAALETEGGSRALRFLVDTNPEAIMLALERAFEQRTEDELREVSNRARRNVMWSLEKLVFRADYFLRATTLLLAFAVAETESYANSSTGIITRLFHLYLSGTEANGQTKLAFADEVLATDNLKAKAIVLRALSGGLETSHFTRSGGAESQGSGPPLRDWEPTNDEAKDYLQGILERLARIANAPSDLSPIARRGIAGHLRGLLNLGPAFLDAVDTTVRDVVKNSTTYWPEALESIMQLLRFEGPGIPDEYRRRIESLRDLMLPRSPEDRLHFHVTNLPWGVVGRDLSEVENDARNLADEFALRGDLALGLVPALSSGEQRFSSVFGNRLATEFTDPTSLLSTALLALASAPAGNPAFVGGLIAGLDDRRPELVKAALDECARDEKLRRFLADLTCRKRVNAADLARLISEIDQDRLPVSDLLYLRLGRALNHLTPTEIEPVIDAALRKKGGGGVAAQIVGMYAHGRPEHIASLHDLMFRVLNAPSLISETPDDLASYNLESFVKALIGDPMYGPKTADLVARWAVFACEQNLDHDLRGKVATFLATALQAYPEIAWSEIKRGIAAANPVSRFCFEGMLGNRYRHHDSTGSLFLVPREVLLDWCREETQIAPQFIVGIAQPLVRVTDDSESWNQIILDILDEYGAQDRVLASLSRNIGTFSNWGSLVPYYTRFIAPLRLLSKHRIPNVRRWANKMLAAYQKMIEDEAKRDAEHKLGIF